MAIDLAVEQLVGLTADARDGFFRRLTALHRGCDLD
jgi:hypothetical protein